MLRKREDKAREYFNRLAGKFGRSYCPGRSWQSTAHMLFGLLPPMVIADLGAGEGTLSQLLARTAKRVIAVDNSEKMVEFGSALAREHGFTNLEYRLGDIQSPPIEPNSIELAIFSQALHHASQPQKAIAAARTILQPGGRIVILDLLSHTFEQARDLYADLWLGFSELELQPNARSQQLSQHPSERGIQGRAKPPSADCSSHRLPLNHAGGLAGGYLPHQKGNKPDSRGRRGSTAAFYRVEHLVEGTTKFVQARAWHDDRGCGAHALLR